MGQSKGVKLIKRPVRHREKATGESENTMKGLARLLGLLLGL